MPKSTFQWGNGVVTGTFVVDDDAPVRLVRLVAGAALDDGPASDAAQPLVEVFAFGQGHARANLRYTDSAIGDRLRYSRHTASRHDGWEQVVIEQVDVLTGLRVRSVLRCADGVAAVQGWTQVVNGGVERVVLQAVTSFASGAFTSAGDSIADTDLLSGHCEWLGESRWERQPIRGQAGLVDLNLPAIHPAQDARGRIAITSRSTWSSGERTPTGIIENRRTGAAWAWQVEHNGAWHAELGERVRGRDGELVLALLGPTEAEHLWSQPLAPGESFESVPVAVAVGVDGWQSAVEALTGHRRALRAQWPLPGGLPVVFNDYMNTLMGDPTTAKLLPLIDAAAAAGAEYFCIDAGWYDDELGDWWDSVGQWLPSTVRFPDGGLRAVVDHITAAGMIPGIWLEPEVIGVRSPMVDQLPDSAFLMRDGVRVSEHARFHLDLRSVDVTKHLDHVVDMLIEEFGFRYFKLDYNITAGAGTDLDAPSPGAGLLEHNRAHLRWLEGTLERHPDLMIENCASGAMRMDYAMLSRLHLQSTSDQQDPLLYPPIAASAPVSLLPEQAANWAYPQPGMSDEEMVFTLCTGMLGRLYLSGHLDGMTDTQLDIVREAVAAHREVRASLASAVPFWPLGLPGWSDPHVALGLRTADQSFLTIWSRDASNEEIALEVAHLRGSELEITNLFPTVDTGPAGWLTTWSPRDGVLRVTPRSSSPAARVLRLRRLT